MSNIIEFTTAENQNSFANFKKNTSMEEVVSTLDALRKKAEKDGLEEVCAIINSAFEICYNAHYILLRKNFQEY